MTYYSAQLPELNAEIVAIDFLPHGVVEVQTSSGSIWLFDIVRNVWTLAKEPEE